MSELGDLLELLHDAHRSSTTIRLEWTQRYDSARASAAFAAWATTQPAGSVDLLRTDGPSTAHSVRSLSHRGWYVPPRLWRQETDRGDGTYLEVSTPTVRWTRDAAGRHTNLGRPSVGDRWPLDLLEPAELLADAVLDLEGRTTHAGRPAIVVRTTPRPHARGTRRWHVESLRLLVDAERGIVLHEESRFEGEAYAVKDVTTIAFDEEIAGALFEPPEEVLSARPVSPPRPPRRRWRRR